MSSDRTALFNHNQIEKIYRMGLVDEEEKQFKERLNILFESLIKKLGIKSDSPIAQTQSDTLPTNKQQEVIPKPEQQVLEKENDPIGSTVMVSNSSVKGIRFDDNDDINKDS